ncbi:WD40/YVTN repeat-like-containing domain superfamily [Sesbania bispinosa]|nr:WD40/YVTN repeat-like-containing domain superfamily [Sesbania bispinosa]
MASPGNPNQNIDFQTLLKATTSNPTPTPTSSAPYHQPHYLPYPIPQMHAPPPPRPVFQPTSLLMGKGTQPQPQNSASIPILEPQRQSSKVPKGRHLIGDDVVYDIDDRMVQPQLEVTPITKYASDPCLLLGRQIAVNTSYICYGLKLGAIRVLNINTALRYLLRGHTQRVTDMVFFAEDLHLLATASTDGKVFVWKIKEGPDEDDKPQITGKVILAIQISGEGESVHPRVCWHPHKQEILMVAIGNHILKIDTMKAGKGQFFSAEEPLKCSVDKLVDGVKLVGNHDGNVTELSMCQWMKSRLVSASADGTVKIWEEGKTSPLAVLRPHDGKPVSSVTFLTAPHRPDHIVLVTAGPLNQELKVWVSDNEEGWLLPSDSESWNCIQTLNIISSSEANPEDAFFNQVVALPRAGLFLLANSKKNTIYAVHIEYGPNPTSTRMDYIAEFTVTMPILSLTGTSDSLPDGEHTVLYCVQTQAIQQYALNLSQCLPPPLDDVEIEKTEPNLSRDFDVLDGSTNLEPGNMSQVHSSGSGSVPVVNLPVNLVSSDVSCLPEASISDTESKPNDLPSQNGLDHIQAAPPPLPPSPKLSRKLSGLKNSANNLETAPTSPDHMSEQTYLDCSVEGRMESEKDSMADVTSSGDSDSLRKNDKVVQNDVSVVSTPPTIFKQPTHLVTPSEIFSTAALSSENSQTCQGTNAAEPKVQDVASHSDAENIEVEVKVVGETGSDKKNTEYYRDRDSCTSVTEKKEKFFYSQASDLGIQMIRETYNIEGVHQADNTIDAAYQTCNPVEEKVQDMSKYLPANSSESETAVAASQSSMPATGKRQKGKSFHVSGTSPPSPSPFNPIDSSNNQGGDSGSSSMEAALPQLSTVQDMLAQLVSMHKEMQKQMNVMVAVPVTKEGRRLEGTLSRNLEKVVMAHSDALWARLQEDNAKKEKLERDHALQMTNFISNFINKDLTALLEKIMKKEMSSIASTITRSISQIIEKTASSVIMESFQKGVGDKALNQLEKSVSSKLEATVARQIQAQFQTSGKPGLQEALKTSLEASIIPSFDMSCNAMLERIDVTFQNGLAKHTTAIQQQYDSAYSPLVMTLRDAINSASSITQTLSGQLADNQRKLLAIAANSKVAADPLVTQISNGLHEMVEDPTRELSRLINEGKFEEAFIGALHRSDVSIVSWLCSQVDLADILTMVPLPLSQGVLLSLLQQLSCDINTETPKKLAWMKDVAAAINPVDPRIAMHVRPILDQMYRTLGHHRDLSTTSPSEASAIRLLMHVINSVLLSCK